MNQINQENIYQDINFFNNIERNFFPVEEISSLKKKNFSLLGSNYEIDPKQNQGFSDNNRKSFDNLITKKNSRELTRFKTQINIKRMNLKNKIPKYPSNYDNNFILAKKNNLYGNKINNNEKDNFSTENNNLKLNSDIFAKKIKDKLNQNILSSNKYKITKIKYKGNNPIFNSINGNNNFDMNNASYNNLTNNNNNDNINFHKKISYDIVHNYHLNSTMPNTYIRRNGLNSHNINDDNEEKGLNQIEKNTNYKKVNNMKNFKNVKFVSQKLIKNKNNKNFKRQNSENKPRVRIQAKSNENDLSWDYGERLPNKEKNINFYKKSKSGIIKRNYYSEKKKRIPMKNKYQNDEDLNDKELDDIADQLELFFENKDKINKTFISKGNNLLNDSSNLSDLAEEIIKYNPEQEISDINNQETVPSTSNPDIDGVFDNSNNNIINTNNISYNIPFGNNKISNTKSYIVNNIIISSPEIKNKNNNLENDINYNFFVVNEYNNTNTNINNEINNDTTNNKNNLNINVPTLVTKTYKSPFILRNGKTKINNKDINEIDDSEINVEFNKFNNTTNNSVNQNIIIELNYPNNINNKIVTNNKINLKSFPKLGKSYSEINNNQINNEKENNKINRQNDKKKLKNSMNDFRFSDSILRDLLSSHKNTPSNNNFPVSEDNKYNKNLDDNKDFTFSQDNKVINYNKEDKNIDNKINSCSEKVEEKNNIINNSIIKSSLKKPKKHVLFNLNSNIYIKFGKEDLITDSQITDESGQISSHLEKNMDLYNLELKTIKPKPIIKRFFLDEIKINTEYISVENLPERQILPDLYDEFEDQDLKSLEKSLEKSVDKILH